MTGTTVIEVALGERSYSVVVGRGLLPSLAERVRIPDGASSVLLITQQGILDAGHVDPVEKALEGVGLEIHRQLVPEGEGAKEAGVLLSLWRAAAQVPLSRRDLVVAVGGGVVGDLAGFLAATYARGISIVQVPTSLLAQVDAAIGGKTGINLPEGKNLVGAFHQPSGVVCDVGVLDTMPDREFVEGLGEIIKCGLIQDPVILDDLEGLRGDVRAAPDVLTGLVRRSVAVKAAVTSIDEREGGQRAILNFGHTYGHAVETLAGYGRFLHGEAVAIGMVVALRLGARMGRTPTAVVERGEAAISAAGLPVRGPNLDPRDVWAVMARDKKAQKDGVRFVILDDLAVPRVVTPEPDDVNAVLESLALGRRI